MDFRVDAEGLEQRKNQWRQHKQQLQEDIEKAMADVRAVGPGHDQPSQAAQQIITDIWKAVGPYANHLMGEDSKLLDKLEQTSKAYESTENQNKESFR